MSREELPTSYAQAIYKMALEEWTSWLGAMRQKLLDDRATAEVLASADAPLAERQKRLQAIAPKGASSRFQQFLGYLLEQGDFLALNDVIGSFEQLVERGAGREIAYVTSALELADDERTKIQESIRRRFGAALDCEFAVDPALLGGLRVRVGDTVIDGSIASRLETLREHLVLR